MSYFNGKRILITGASGYLATKLVSSLAGVPCAIIRLSRNKTLSPVKGKFTISNLNGDIRDSKVWKLAIDKKLDIIYHFSGQSSVYKAEEDPFADLENNVFPMLRMLESCRDLDCKPIIVFAGTETEVGMHETLPVNETFTDHPITLYDLHKLMAENYLKLFCRQGYINGVSLRLANVYGPGPKPKNSDRGVLNQMIRKALAGDPLTIYGTGKFTRDYIFIDDVIDAFLSVPMNSSQMNGRHFIIGSGVGNSVAQAINLVADRVREKKGASVLVKHVPAPSNLSPIESRNFIADCEEFKQVTGWKPKYSLEKGIDLTLEKYSSDVTE